MVKAICTSLVAFCISTMAVDAQIPAFRHIVIIEQTDRTPDNLFQGLCSPARRCSTTPSGGQYNIQTGDWLDKNSPTGVTQPSPWPFAPTFQVRHDHKNFITMCDADPTTGACRMDGAGDIPCDPAAACPAKPQFTFVDNSAGIVNPYLAIATQYGWANYMFQTNQGTGFPAHQILFSGTSAVSAADDAQAVFAGTDVHNSNGKAGCIAPVGANVGLITPNGETSSVYPCFKHLTMADLGIDWKYYAAVANSLWTAPNAIANICKSSGAGGTCTGQAWLNNVDLNPADVLKDVANCQLRSVSWVVPTTRNSDHSEYNANGGPSWVASVVNAIGSSTTCDDKTGYWNNTAILITWLGWGGWYDHEPPIILAGPQGDYQYGFRAPFVFVSAYTPAGYINNVPHDFGSILRFIEHNFGIQEGALNFADARASYRLDGFFHLNTAPRPFVKINAAKVATTFSGTPGRASCVNESVSALTRQYSGLDTAAADLGYPTGKELDNAIVAFCQ